jgi:hypothetical protein
MPVKPITDTLRQIGKGALLDEAAEALVDLVNVVSSTGKSGKITLEIAIKKATRAGAMAVTGRVKVVKPADEPMEAMLWATPEGNLVADDPSQLNLSLKSVSDKKPAEFKTA